MWSFVFAGIWTFLILTGRPRNVSSINRKFPILQYSKRVEDWAGRSVLIPQVTSRGLKWWSYWRITWSHFCHISLYSKWAELIPQNSNWPSPPNDGRLGDIWPLGNCDRGIGYWPEEVLDIEVAFRFQIDWQNDEAFYLMLTQFEALNWSRGMSVPLTQQETKESLKRYWARFKRLGIWSSIQCTLIRKGHV